jgi:type VI protein secretion system component Hcp
VENGQTLGAITIELQRQNAKGQLETYATYAYTNAFASSVEDSGAAGVSPTQKLEFVYQKLQVTVGTATHMDDWETPVA